VRHEGGDLVVHGVAARLERARTYRKSAAERQQSWRDRQNVTRDVTRDVTRESRGASRVRNAAEIDRSIDQEDPPVVPQGGGRWGKALETLRERATTPQDRDILRRWLEPLHVVESEVEVLFLAPTAHHRGFVEDNYRRYLEELLEGVRVEFGVQQRAVGGES
jgi:hypothetical protein